MFTHPKDHRAGHWESCFHEVARLALYSHDRDLKSSIRTFRIWKPLATTVVFVCLGVAMMGQVLEVPVSVQVPLMLKATTYDRAFAPKLQKNGVMHVGICYQAQNRVSVKEMEELKLELSKVVTGFKVQVTPIALVDSENFAERAEWASLSIVYITSMRGLDLKALLLQARKHQVLSVGTDAALAAKGVTMGFELVDSRPKFVINRDSAAAEGCDFSSQLLKLATIY